MPTLESLLGTGIRDDGGTPGTFEAVYDLTTAAIAATTFVSAQRGLIIWDTTRSQLYMCKGGGVGIAALDPLGATVPHTNAQGDSGDVFYQLVPDADGASTQPPWQMFHERALFGSTYDHVVKMGWNAKAPNASFGSVWISMESNFETSNPSHPYSTELHLSMAKAGGTEKRVFSAACERDADYIETAITTDSMQVYPTVGNPYFSWLKTGMDFGTGFGLRKGTNNEQWLSQLNAAGSSYKQIAKVNAADQVQIAPGQGTVLIDGPLNRGEVAINFSTTIVVNCSQADQFRISQMTDDATIDLQGLLLGETKGRIYLQQAAVGGKKITAITASDTGRTRVMSATVNPTTINTAAFLVADAYACLTYEVTNAGGEAIVIVALEATAAIAYA